MMNEYLRSIMDRDPAAKSSIVIVLTYPGVKAIFFYRIIIPSTNLINKNPPNIDNTKITE